MSIIEVKSLSSLIATVAVFTISQNAFAERDLIALKADAPLTDRQISEIESQYSLKAVFSADKKEAIVFGRSNGLIDLAITKPKEWSLFTDRVGDAIFVPSINFNEARDAKLGVWSDDRQFIPADLQIEHNKLKLTHLPSNRSFELVFSNPITTADYVTIPTVDTRGDICNGQYLEVRVSNGAISYLSSDMFYFSLNESEYSFREIVNTVYESLVKKVPANQTLPRRESCTPAQGY